MCKIKENHKLFGGGIVGVFTEDGRLSIAEGDELQACFMLSVIDATAIPVPVVVTDGEAETLLTRVRSEGMSPCRTRARLMSTSRRVHVRVIRSTTRSASASLSIESCSISVYERLIFAGKCPIGFVGEGDKVELALTAAPRSVCRIQRALSESIWLWSSTESSQQAY